MNMKPEFIQDLVIRGQERIKDYRRARIQFIKEFVGQHFKNINGISIDEPLNLLFSTVRAYVPNLVSRYPINNVTTEIIQFKDYAYLLGRSVDCIQRQLKIKSLLRAWIVDAIFGLGIVESGLCGSNTILVDDNITIDPGQIFSQIVDLDDFMLDPDCNSTDEARLLGHFVRVVRRELLGKEGFDDELIMQLPAYNPKTVSNKAEDLTKKNNTGTAANRLDDFVEVAKLWIPDTNQIIYMGNPDVKKSGSFLAIKDFYGPKKGPYTFLSLSPQIPQNPIPVSPISVWFDMHKMVNEVASKVIKRIKKQKDAIFYRPSYSDLATELESSEDMEYFACDDPGAVNAKPIGGIGAEYVPMLNQLQTWYNYIAGNPDQLSGVRQGADTATGQSILQNNATIGISDMRQIIDDGAADISFHHAWYLHFDPLINMPFIKRQSGQEDVQLLLTPEQRRGDILQFVFNIKPRSMGSGLDPQMRSQRIIQFATNVVPAGATTAQICSQLGIPFNLQKHLCGVAEELDILDWYTDAFDDPKFQERLKIMAQFDAGKAQVITPQGIAQNSGFPMARGMPGAPNSGASGENAQAGANESQSVMKGGI